MVNYFLCSPGYPPVPANGRSISEAIRPVLEAGAMQNGKAFAWFDDLRFAYIFDTQRPMNDYQQYWKAERADPLAAYPSSSPRVRAAELRMLADAEGGAK